ncbi:MAG: HAMP domain-containing histidine kinase [Candidatus Gastranaerophilales bacterium]|nr:HAMP domain-containing histidine kinase [Candidatus Gastranaerophilales bacterium]
MQKNIKEEFISTLSHEIRTPLTSIKGFCQTMLNSWDALNDEKKKEFLGIILNQSKRLISLVENVLNVAKIDSDSSNLVLSKVEINKLIQNCANMLKIANPDFNFEYTLSKNELNCLCDNDKTQQIILNILDNAIKYSINSKKIEIKTKNEADFNVISIKNFGNYIEEDYFDKIFEKFYRIDSYIKTQTQGSGLGLYIAKSLIEKMQGKISVKSYKDENSVEFLIYIPIYEVEKLTKNIGV